MEFGIPLTFEKTMAGYAFDRFLFTPSRGIKMSDVKKYAEDVAQATEMENVRIIAPVPGTKFV
jgi:DNA segregation ATPase FtsK/SpoIIIE-like protein